MGSSSPTALSFSDLPWYFLLTAVVLFRGGGYTEKNFPGGSLQLAPGSRPHLVEECSEEHQADDQERPVPGELENLSRRASKYCGGTYM